MKDGVIADFNAAELMIRGMIKMINPRITATSPETVLGRPGAVDLRPRGAWRPRRLVEFGKLRIA